jgi:hypothetical protein
VAATRALGIEVGDGGLMALGDWGAIFGPSPALALVEDEHVVFGAAAAAACRVKPRLVASDFWARLDEEPMPPPFPPGLRPVDLVHGQLAELWQEAGTGVSEVVLAVGGGCEKQQLARLLGIAQALEIPIAALVDAAVAAASLGFAGERLLHTALGQRRAVVTEIHQGRSLVRERVARIERWGRDEVVDAQMRGAAASFVTQARFDPLHDASTEQRLFDSLPAWLKEVERKGAALAELEAPGGRRVAAELTREQAEAWTARFADELQQQVSLLKRAGEPTCVLVNAQAARLPGLVDRLRGVRGVEVALLPEQAAAVGALRAREALRGPGASLRYATRLPRPEAPLSTDSDAAMLLPAPPRLAPAPASARTPTHLLLGSVAHPITPEPLVVGTAPVTGSRCLRIEGEIAGISRTHCCFFESAGQALVEDLSTWGTFLNGERVAGRAVLAAGDRVRVGSPGVELVLIASGQG